MNKEIYLAGGCFWGVEKYLAFLPGVFKTEVGYANGQTVSPTYEEVCRKNTGHAETVKVEYDSDRINLMLILDMFYEVINPTSINHQGGDRGEQYRTGIYYTDYDDLPIIEASIQQLQRDYNRPIAIEVMPLENYYIAEKYHQKYLDKNPNGYCHIGLSAFKKAKQSQSAQYHRKTQEELKTDLSELQYKVTQQNATEPPFQNEYNDERSLMANNVRKRLYYIRLEI